MEAKAPITAKQLAMSIAKDFKHLAIVTLPVNAVVVAVTHRKELSQQLFQDKMTEMVTGNATSIVVYNISEALLSNIVGKELTFNKRIGIVFTSTIAASLARRYMLHYALKKELEKPAVLAGLVGLEAGLNVVTLMFTSPEAPEWFREIGLKKVGDTLDRIRTGRLSLSQHTQ